jgi:hypothetical protein
MKKLVYIWLLLLLACTTGKQEGVITITIDTDKARQADISEFIDSVRYIKLETTPDNLIGSINKAFFVAGKVVVVDPGELQILVFDEQGKFLNKIQRLGRGPEEFLGFVTVLLDPAREQLIVYSQAARKVLFYGLDGSFVKEITDFNDGAFIHEIMNLPNGNFLCYMYDSTPETVGEKASGLWEVDSAGNFVRGHFTIQDVYPTGYNRDNFHFTSLPGGKVSLRDAQFNDIYHFEGDSLRKYISYHIKNDPYLTFKGLSFTMEKYTKNMGSQEKGNYIFTAWMDFVERFYTVYSKRDEQTVLIYPVKAFWEGHKVAEPMYYLFIDCNRSDILLTAVAGLSIPEFLEKEDADPAVKAALREIIAGMSEKDIDDMNPVLQLLYVKK